MTSSSFDQRRGLRPTTAGLRKVFEALTTRPLVNEFDLEEMAPLFEVLPELKFPITSAGHFLDQLEPHKLVVHQIAVRPTRMIKYMPAYYFPIWSYDNLIEKMAELIRANRPVVAPGEVDAIKRQLPQLRYPIASAEALMKILGTQRTYRFEGGRVNIKMAVKLIPEKVFPITSDADLERKLRYLVNRRPLITGHERILEP